MAERLKELYLKCVQDDIESLYQKGRFHLTNKSFELASFYFTQMLNKQPQHFWANVHLAEIAAEQKLFAKALNRYQKALTLANSANQTCSVNYGLASVFSGMGLVDLAEQHYLQNLAQYPEHVYFYTGLAELYKTHQPDAVEKIAELYQQALVLAPHLKWLETELKACQNRIGKKTEPESLKKPSAFQLHLQGAWSELFAQENALQAVVKGRANKEINNILKALPQDAFTDLSAFYRYIADHLSQGFVAGELFDDRDQLNSASVFLLRAIKTSVIADATLYIQAINILSFLERFAEAEPLALQALLNYADHAELLLATARLMHEKCKNIDKNLKTLDVKIAQLAKDQAKIAAVANAAKLSQSKLSQLRTEKTQLITEKTSALGISRLLFGEAVSIAPEQLAEQDWSNLISIHEQADRHKAKKFANLKTFLLTSTVAKQAQALDIDANLLARADVWLHELSALLGDFSIEAFFDLAYYCEQTRLWFTSVDTALSHYFTKGWKNNAAVHPSFDGEHVRRQLQGRDKPSSAPELLLFLRYERELALTANILFDARRLTANTPDDQVSPWLHYLAGGWRTLAEPSDFFDTELYLDGGAYSETEQTDSVLVHFLRNGATKDCNRLFHTQFYLKHYRPLLAGKPPIVHYLTEGAYQGYLPNPFCELSNKSGLERIDYLKLLSL